jgi:hypothetical protein
MGRFLTGPDQLLSRRKIFKGIAGAAAVGAGGIALIDTASPASAATMATTVEPGAVAPAVVALADAATIAVDASLGNDFRVTIAGNHAMGTPTNPTDGQKITVQVTQGTGGPFTLSWSSAYQFSAALPQPTLSTTAGDTDLLCFIYNAAKGTWLFVAFLAGFTAASAPPPPPMGTYRLFATVAGPTTPVSYSGPFMSGVVFTVTTGGCWLDGYWWWVCSTGQSTAAQKFTLWCMYNGPDSGSLVPGSTVTSGTLTAGQWNYVQLPTPIPLAIEATYVAATGFTGSFPDTNSQWGNGDPYGNGIVNGPLTAYSDVSGTRPSPFNTAQSVFSVASSDPTTLMPIYGSSACNFWMDVQVDTNPPAGASYRLWPGYPTLPGALASDTQGYTLATEFKLSESCTLDKIWFYSASGASVLPTRCAIWNVSSQGEVSGTDNASPTWSGAAGSGWVSCAYSGVTLPAGDYKVAAYHAGGQQWFQGTPAYWTTGPGGNGITAGPLTAPSASAATSPGQGTYNIGSWAYPQTYAAAGGENYWVDVEVTPAS